MSQQEIQQILDKIEELKKSLFGYNGTVGVMETQRTHDKRIKKIEDWISNRNNTFSSWLTWIFRAFIAAMLTYITTLLAAR